MRVKTFHGKQIEYEGIGFEGSPRHVFWNGYIQPFLEAMIVKEIEDAVAMAKARGVDGKLLLPEVQGLLNAACQKVFTRMAEIDQRIQGKGFPDNIKSRSIHFDLETFKQFIALRVDSEVAMWKSQVKQSNWLAEHQVIVSTVIGVIGLVLAAAALF